MNYQMRVFLGILCLSFSWQVDAKKNVYPLAKKRMLDIPVQKRSVIISRYGFFPQTISLFEGEKVQLFLTSTMKAPTCFFMPDRKLYLTVNNREITEGELYFRKAGVYKFYCPLGKISGEFRVLVRKNKVIKNVERKVASKKIVKFWKPKEYNEDKK